MFEGEPAVPWGRFSASTRRRPASYAVALSIPRLTVPAIRSARVVGGLGGRD